VGAKAGRISRAITSLRDQGALLSTGDLVAAVRPWTGTKPAKTLARVFLAVRSAVNREIENLTEVLEALPEILARGGRACVIAYHSTEDRVVKTSFKKFSGRCVCAPGRLVCDCGRTRLYKVLTPKPIAPTAEEVDYNPSARSARLRAVEKM
jgi:16S rRNA (cytosine1402-N4)-methyltransferase